MQFTSTRTALIPLDPRQSFPCDALKNYIISLHLTMKLQVYKEEEEKNSKSRIDDIGLVSEFVQEGLRLQALLELVGRPCFH